MVKYNLFSQERTTMEIALEILELEQVFNTDYTIDDFKKDHQDLLTKLQDENNLGIFK